MKKQLLTTLCLLTSTQTFTVITRSQAKANTTKTSIPLTTKTASPALLYIYNNGKLHPMLVTEYIALNSKK